MMAYCQAVTKKGKFEGFLKADTHDEYEAKTILREKAREHDVWPYGLLFKNRDINRVN